MTTTGQAAAPGDAGDTQGVADTAGVADVVRRMRALAVRLPPSDGVAVFDRVYLAVTEEFARRLGRGRFPDGPEAAELAVLFAGRYLAAVEAADGPGPDGPDTDGSGADGRVPACWQPLVRARADPAVHPLQFALAGITAHVGHDLALAVVDTCRATGRTPDAVAPDFDAVGAVLTAIEARVREELMPGPDLLERLDPLTHAVASWSLARARDGAWAAARLLWAIRDRREAYQECARALDVSVGAMARAVLAPFPAGAARGLPAQSSGSSTGAISS
jgi:hypothetical protein